MKRTKRFVCLFVAAVMFLSVFLLPGCGTSGKDNQSNTTAGDTSDAAPSVSKEEPTEIRIIVGQLTDKSVEKDTYIEELVKEKVNIKFVKTAVPSDTLADKTNVMLAAGSLDLIKFSNLPDYYSFAAKGYLMDLTNILPDKLPGYNAVMTDLYREKLTYKGKIYGINEIKTETPWLTSGRLSIRKDWLEQLNLQVPKTMDDVLVVAKAFYDADLGKAGKDNLAIITACNGFSYMNLDWVFGAFGVAYDQWHLDGAGNVVSYDVDPKMKDAMEWLNKAYKANLLDKDFLTQKEPQMKDKILNDAVGIWGGHWGTLYADPWPRQHEEKKLRAEGKLKEGEKYEYNRDEPFVFWDQIDPPSGPRGESGLKAGTRGTLFPAAIPKNANPKSLDGVYRFIEFFATEEGTLLGQYGVEGVDYTMTEAGPVPGPAVGSTDYTQYKTDKGIGWQVGNFGNGGALYPLDKEYEWAKIFNLRKTQYGAYAADQIYNKGQAWVNKEYLDITSDQGLVSPSATQARAKLSVIRDEYFAKFIFGELELSKWDEFVNTWKKSGGDDLTKEYTQLYKEKQ